MKEDEAGVPQAYQAQQEEIECLKTQIQELAAWSSIICRNIRHVRQQGSTLWVQMR